MVNDILDTKIILENPDITYKPYLEYLVGDDLYKDSSTISNEMKKFLCKNILYNNEIVDVDGQIVDCKGKYKIVTKQHTIQDVNTKLFEKYNSLQSVFITLNFSYNDLMNCKLFSLSKDADYQIIPLVYKDFYADIDIDHMMKDYSSFSCIIDYSKGIVYVNDVLLNYIKQNPSERHNIICNVLYNKDKFEKSLKCEHDDAVNPIYWTKNNHMIVDAIQSNIQEVEDFNLDYLPKEITLSYIEEPYQYNTPNTEYFISFVNLPYQIYSKYVSHINGQLYHNNKFGYFSQDKNRTAINVLAYDICKNGIQKPLVFKLFNNQLISQSKTRLLIAEYLKLPTIPVALYQSSEWIENSDKRKINLFENDQRISLDSIQDEMKRLMYPTVPKEILDTFNV